MEFGWCKHSFLLLLLLAITTFSEAGLATSFSSLQHSCHINEKLALLEFKHNFVINCAASDSAYAHPKTSDWATDDESCCLWDGVTCNVETGHVIGLDLSSSCLYGSFPPNNTLFNIPYLEHLNLADNDFKNSPIFPRLGHKLGKLTILKLSGSAFIGQVPLDISQLSSLSILDLSDNFGLEMKAFSLERLVRNLTRLNKLILDYVDISSHVPNLLANFTSLSSISMDFCNLYGEFPTRVFQLPHLQDLSLEGNINLKGFLPKFEHSSPLRSLDIDTTSFFGDIPPSIGTLAHLLQLSLGDCKFSGQIPSSLGNLTKLSILELDNNNFDGKMPSSFSNLTHLQTLTISNLDTSSDKLFIWLSKLKKLTNLVVEDMKLTGEIHSIQASLSNLTHLYFLSLMGTQLEGSIPPSINVYALLKFRHLKYVELSGLTLTFDSNITANESVSKFGYLGLDSCNLTEFPQFLQTQDELQEISLRYNRIHGVVPTWFLNITGNSLLVLDLGYNLLSGFEEPVKFLPWVNMKILHLDGNKMQGPLPIPSNSMLYYGVYNNSFTGDIPLDICQASSLIYLDLSYNQLSGQIPECIARLGNSLQVLDLGGNNFHGTIPSGYPKSSKLKMINLSLNQLSGNLPRSLANCNMLEVLDIGSNQISDAFPSWLGSFPHLQILVLRHNNFHGEIGTQNDSSGFHSLRIMDLSHNFHTGSLPTDYFRKWDAMKVADEAHSKAYTTSFFIALSISPSYITMGIEYDYTTTISNKGNDMLFMKMQTVFRLIDFSSNNFTGRIPDFIGELKGLQSINLSSNNLEGGIPSSLANIRDLESLDLSNNKLSGEIPQQLAQITSLEIFNVSHNLLVGPIPQGNQFETFDNSSFDGNIGLCGDTLSKKCRSSYLPPPSALVTEDQSDDKSTVIDWIFRSLGCVSGVIIGYVIGMYMTDKHHDWFVDTFGRRKRRTRSKPRRRS